MKDLGLTQEGDLALEAGGDLKLTDSVRQAVRIRLKWFKGEWRLNPAYGLDYYGEILQKNPKPQRIRQLIRRAVLSVSEVEDVAFSSWDWNPQNRQLKIILQIKAGSEAWQEELVMAG